MAETGFGRIIVTLDGIEAECLVYAVAERPQFAGVDGAVRLEYKHFSDGRAHELRCFLADGSGFGPDSGENYEAGTAYIGKGSITIGCEGDFSDISKYDFDGYIMENGVCVIIHPDTGDRRFIFGVSWVNECAEHDVRTWYGADPTLDKRI